MFYDNLPPKYVLSSGGHSTGVPAGGIAVYTNFEKLVVQIKIRHLQTEWVYEELNVQPDQWFDLMIVWKKNSELRLYIDFGIDAIVSGTHYRPSPITISDKIYIGRPSTSDNAGNFGRKLITITISDVFNQYLIPFFKKN